jgi:hypothetical protein
VLRGDPVGSSTAGEQPKFTTTLRDSDGYRSVIVKFSERNDTPGGQRWADLLHCEHLASAVLRTHGHSAAESEIVHADGRTFLQSTRFDRTPVLGRAGYVSLAALDAAFYGHATIEWWRVAETLRRDGWLNGEHAARLRVLGLFGALIGNTDMHLGNAALVLADAPPLSLAPAYDMLPMRFRPAASGEVVEREYEVLLPAPELHEEWRLAATIAGDFWHQAATDQQLSVGFRAIAERARAKLANAVTRLG